MKDEVMTNIVSLLESDETFAEISLYFTCGSASGKHRW